MKAKLNDLNIGQIFQFDNFPGSYEITKKQERLSPGLMGIEVIDTFGKQPFYIWIDTITNELRMYSQPIFQPHFRESEQGANSEC